MSVLAGPASATSNGLWSIAPVPGQGSGPYVVVTLTPGVPYRSAVAIDNLTAQPLTLNLYAADAFNTRGGGLSLRRRIDPQVGVGAWTHLAASQVTVPVGAQVVVPFVIDASHGAQPGDHVGGIVAEQTQGVPSASRSLPVTVIQAVGLRVYARIRGELRPALAVRHTTMQVTASGATPFGGAVSTTVHFTVANAGNVVLSPRALVSWDSAFGATGARRAFPVGQLLPGSSVSYSIPFSGLTPWGSLQATVTAQATTVRASAAVGATVIPWGLVGVVVVAVVALVVAVTAWRRRRRGARPDREAVPAELG